MKEKMILIIGLIGLVLLSSGYASAAMAEPIPFPCA